MEDNKLNSIINKFRENKMAHAYLIETNNQEACLKDLLQVIKFISCPKEHTENCSKCNLCNLINLNNLPTLKIIEPDGNTIKKVQIQELKESFSAKPIYTSNNIYIIKNAEKLNASSANTMLKFLEEPDGQVLGFFITNNKDNIILTIQSRCQIMKAEYENKSELIDNLSADDNKKVFEILYAYLKDVEENHSMAIFKNKKEILGELVEIINLELVFKIMLDIYKNALYYKREIRNSFVTYKDFQFILDNNEETLLKKINLIINYIDNLNYNLNSELMLDKFVIEMSGINE